MKTSQMWQVDNDPRSWQGHKYKGCRIIIIYISHTRIWNPVEKTCQYPYPRLEGTGFVRIQMLLPQPVPQHTLPVTPAGFWPLGIPYDNPSVMCVTWCGKCDTIFPCVVTIEVIFASCHVTNMSHHNVLYIVIMGKLTTHFFVTPCRITLGLSSHIPTFFFFIIPNFEKFSKSILLLLKKNWASAKQYANGCNIAYNLFIFTWSAGTLAKANFLGYRLMLSERYIYQHRPAF